MANKEIVFADRIVGIAVVNGLVRIDLAVVSGPAKTKDDKPALKGDVTHQLVMPLEGFVAGLAAQQKVVKELADRQGKAKAKAKAADTALGSPAA